MRRSVCSIGMVLLLAAAVLPAGLGGSGGHTVSTLVKFSSGGRLGVFDVAVDAKGDVFFVHGGDHGIAEERTPDGKVTLFAGCA